MLITKFLLFFGLIAVSADDVNEKDAFVKEMEEPINILIPQYVGSRSHIKFVLEISNVLSAQGHNITYATTIDKVKFGESYNVSIVNMGAVDYSRGNPSEGLAGIIPPLYDQFFLKVQDLIDNAKPDVVICDFFSVACIDICQKNRIPLIVGMQALDSSMNPVPYINDDTDIRIPVTTEHMSFLRRWYHTFIQPGTAFGGLGNLEPRLNKVRSKYGIPHKKGHWGDLDTEYKMLNTFIGWEASRPLHPTFELVGPIRSPNIAKLTPDLIKFLNQWNSVLYIAFGSHQYLSKKELELVIQASFMALKDGVIDGVILATVTARSRFPDEFQTVNGIIKTDDLFNNKIHQFKLLGYAPQESIMKHDSTKVFLSHGGLESVFEGIFTSTHIVVMPFLGDQPGNGQLVIENNLGGMVNRETDSASHIFKEIKRVVVDKDGSIKRDMKRVRTISHFRSIGVGQAGNKIVSFAKAAKACRTPNDPLDQIPCEIKHLVTVDQRISHFRAYQWDIYVFHYLLITLIVGITIHFIVKYTQLLRRGQYTLIPDQPDLRNHD